MHDFLFPTCSPLVIIFVFNAPRNKIKDSFESVHRHIIFILGALQVEKLTKTSGACFAGHPVVNIYLNFIDLLFYIHSYTTKYQHWGSYAETLDFFS